MNSTFHVRSKPGGSIILTTVTAFAATVEIWIRTVDHAFQSKRNVVFGLDVEWKPGRRPNANANANADNPVAILQICYGNHCLIIQLLHLDRIPDSLRRFLSNPNYHFAGVDIARDAVRLQIDHGLTCGILYDVREEALQVSSHRERLSYWPGLQELANKVVGITLSKPMCLTLSDWEAKELSDEQVLYACLDAYASSRIGDTLRIPMMVSAILEHMASKAEGK